MPRGKGFGSVVAKGKGYYGRYTGPDGRKHMVSHPNGRTILFPTKGGARAGLAGIQGEIAKGAWVPPSEMKARQAAEASRADAERFATYASTWVAQRRTKSGAPIRPKTRANYIEYVEKGLAAFANDRLTDITASRVRAWHSSRAMEAATAAGVEARFLRSVFATAVEDGLVRVNPVPAALGRSSAGQRHRPPTDEELAVLISAMPERLRVAVYIAAYGGLRIGEWRALRRSDLMKVDGRYVVSVTRQATYVNKAGWHIGPPKSDAGVRNVTLPDFVTPVVDAHLAAHVARFPQSLLFQPTGGGEFLDGARWNAAWNPARDAAGVRQPVLDKDGKPTGKHVAQVREHDLRGYAATAIMRNGGTLRDVMQILGHSTADAALVYQHTNDARMAELTALFTPPVLNAQSNITPITGAKIKQ